jgi:crotonobetainyl-CoA:carnitine CoA-transferase CaiB-like acyl-CoA transferase
VSGPLAGLRVLDLGTRISAPFCAGLLGEQGAEVIKVEQPGAGDFMRTIGPFADDPDGKPYSLFWSVEGRGRRSVTLDLRKPEGQALFRQLAETADVVVENFRPGTLEKWNIAPDQCADRLIWVRISVFGQDGPWSQRPGLDRLGIAYGGLLHVTGYADRPPVRPGITVSDYLTGVFAAEAALSALYARDRPGGSGAGAVIDAPLYGSIMRIMEWTFAGHDRLGVVRGREGNRLANSAPLDNYATSDGAYVCIVGGGDANFKRVCLAMDRPELITDERFVDLRSRARNADLINGIVAGWCAERTAAEVEEACLAQDVPVGTAFTAADIAECEHMIARGDLIAIDDPVIGPVKQQAPYPRSSVVSRQEVPVGAPLLGAHNDEIWGPLLGESAYTAARNSGAI